MELKEQESWKVIWFPSNSDLRLKHMKFFTSEEKAEAYASKLVDCKVIEITKFITQCAE